MSHMLNTIKDVLSFCSNMFVSLADKRWTTTVWIKLQTGLVKEQKISLWSVYC